MASPKTFPEIQFLSVLPIVLVILMGATSAAAQNVTTLKITVTDPNGAAIPNAKISLTQKGSDFSRTQTAADDGSVLFSSLPPGRYDISVEVPNFKRFVQQDVELTFNEARVIAVVVGTEINMVSIAGVEREFSEDITSLPNQNNDLTPALQLAVGSVATGTSSLGRIIIDGKGADQQTTRLDGVDFTVLSDLPTSDPAIDPLGSLTTPQAAADQDNFGPTSRAFTSRFGPGTGTVSEIPTFGQIGFTATGKFTRPRDRWTTEMYGQLRNDALNARNYFDYEGRNGLRSARFGVKGGRGFDKRGRTYLFLGLDGTRARTEKTIYESVPVDAKTCCLSGLVTQYVGGYLPRGTAVTPASTNPDFVVARRRAKTSVNANAFSARFDFTPYSDSGKADDPRLANAVTLRWTRQGTENLVPEGVTGRMQRQNILLNNVLAGYSWWTSAATTHTLKFGLNQTRARVKVETPFETNTVLNSSLISLSGTVIPTGLVGQAPTIPVATLGGMSKTVGRGFRQENISTSIAYDIAHDFGANDSQKTFSAGIEGRLIRMNLDRQGGLTYSFSSVNNLRQGTPSQVTFLSDLSGPAPFSNSSGPRHPRQEYFLSYLMLTHHVGPKVDDPTNRKKQARLILTYGLRYDYFGSARERDNRVAIVDPLTGILLPATSRFYETEKFNFQPRLSVAYRAGANGTKYENTVIRAGIGLYSGVPRAGDLLLPIESDRFSTGIVGAPFPTTAEQVISNFITSPDTRQFQPLSFSKEFVGFERSYKWETQLTQTISGFDLGILYTGNIGRNLPLANITNKIVSVTTNPDPSQPAIVRREFDIVRNGLLLKPFGEFFYRSSEGRSSYNAMTVSFGRNVKAIVSSPKPWLQTALTTFSVQYTLSRNVGNASGTLLSNPFDPGADFGSNSATPRHNFKVSSVYQLWSAHRESPTNPLLGWKLASSLRLSSGIPFVVRLTRPDIVYTDASGKVFGSPAVGRKAVINTPGGGESAATRVPDLLPGINPYSKNNLEFLNPAAFAIPAPGNFGNLKRGQLRGPKVFNVDVSLRRNLFEIGDQKFLSGQFQMDIYNVFNRANFSLPIATLPNVLGTSTIDNQLQPGAGFTRAAASNFGMLTAADQGRVIQFSLTLRMNQGFTTYIQ